MTTLTNSAEGITPSGTTVSVANSGGASGNAFDAVTVTSAGQTCASDNAHVSHGALSIKFATGATAAGTFVRWNTSMGTQTTIWFRLSAYYTANPASSVRLWNATASGVSCGSILVTSTGKLLFANSAGTTILTSTNSIPLNAWFRLEGFLTGNASTGQLEFKLFLSRDAATPDETQTSAATQATTGPPTDYTYVNGGTSVANFGPIWVDDFGLSSTGYLGPVLESPLGRTLVRRVSAQPPVRRNRRQFPVPGAAPPVVPMPRALPSRAKLYPGFMNTRVRRQFPIPGAAPPVNPMPRQLLNRYRLVGFTTRRKTQQVPPQFVPPESARRSRTLLGFVTRRQTQLVPAPVVALVGVPLGAQSNRSRILFGTTRRAKRQLVIPGAPPPPNPAAGAQPQDRSVRNFGLTRRPRQQLVPAPLLPPMSLANRSRWVLPRRTRVAQFIPAPPVVAFVIVPQNVRSKPRFIGAYRSRVAKLSPAGAPPPVPLSPSNIRSKVRFPGSSRQRTQQRVSTHHVVDISSTRARQAPLPRRSSTTRQQVPVTPIIPALTQGKEPIRQFSTFRNRRATGPVPIIPVVVTPLQNVRRRIAGFVRRFVKRVSLLPPVGLAPTLLPIELDASIKMLRLDSLPANKRLDAKRKYLWLDATSTSLKLDARSKNVRLDGSMEEGT